jgi:hypothetical protein
MTLGTLLIVILYHRLLGGFRDWGRGPFCGTGYYGGGGLGLLLVVVLLLDVRPYLEGFLIKAGT